MTKRNTGLTSILGAAALAAGLGAGAAAYSPAQAQQVSNQTYANEIVIPREGATTFQVRNRETGRTVARGQIVGENFDNNNGFTIGNYRVLPQSEFGTLEGLGNFQGIYQLRIDPFSQEMGVSDSQQQYTPSPSPSPPAPSPSPNPPPGGGLLD